MTKWHQVRKAHKKQYLNLQQEVLVQMLKMLIWMCLWLCTTAVCSTAQIWTNSSDNLPLFSQMFITAQKLSNGEWGGKTASKPTFILFFIFEILWKNHIHEAENFRRHGAGLCHLVHVETRDLHVHHCMLHLNADTATRSSTLNVIKHSTRDFKVGLLTINNFNN